MALVNPTFIILQFNLSVTERKRLLIAGKFHMGLGLQYSIKKIISLLLFWTDIIFIVKVLIMFPLICFILGSITLTILQLTHLNNYLMMLLNHITIWLEYGEEGSMNHKSFYNLHLEKESWYFTISCLAIAYTQGVISFWEIFRLKPNNRLSETQRQCS